MWFWVILGIVLSPFVLFAYGCVKTYFEIMYYKNQGVQYSSLDYFTTFKSDIKTMMRTLKAYPHSFSAHNWLRNTAFKGQKIGHFVGIN